MIVDSNAPSPLKYTDPTYQGSLFVRAKIYDTSGVSPSLASTVNLAQIDNGTYWGKFTFTAGKTYLVQKLVYTDGTYATVDQSYAQDNDDVQCIDLKTANLDVAVSTRLATAGYTAPDNADILLIKAKTDNLPADPASNTQVNTRAPASTALDNTVWTNAKAAFVDAAISSRLAAGSYTAPDNAGIAAIEAKTNNLPSDPADNSEILAAIAAIPGGGGGGGCTSDNCAISGTVEALELTGTVTVTEDLSNC